MYNTWKWSTGESYYKSARLEKSQNLNEKEYILMVKTSILEVKQ